MDPHLPATYKQKKYVRILLRQRGFHPYGKAGAEVAQLLGMSHGGDISSFLDTISVQDCGKLIQKLLAGQAPQTPQEAPFNPPHKVQQEEPKQEAPKEEESKQEAEHKKGEHFLTWKLEAYVRQGVNVFLKGPAGSGKTTAAEVIANRLSLPFYAQSMGPQTAQSTLLGYMDAHGNYVPGFLFKPFTEGGICLLDELDNASASVVTILNSALANGYCSFPHGMFKKHPNFRCIVSGNTFGLGADTMYVGRQQLDAASLDRFVMIVWSYDEAFERHLTETQYAGKQTDKWITFVHKVRRAVDTLKLRIVVSPRASLNGANLLKAGIPWDVVAEDVLFAKMSKDDRMKIEGAL